MRLRSYFLGIIVKVCTSKMLVLLILDQVKLSSGPVCFESIYLFRFGYTTPWALAHKTSSGTQLQFSS